MSRFLSFMLTTLIGISYLGASVFEKTNPVDQKLPVNRILYALWNQHDIAVPAPVSDAAFLRRATLTLAGRLPSAVFFPTLNIGVIVLTLICGILCFKERIRKKELLVLLFGGLSIFLLNIS